MVNNTGREEGKPYWAVALTINYSNQTYWGMSVDLLPGPTDDLRAPFIQVQADDEIGAFNEAQKILRRLGFRLGA